MKIYTIVDRIRAKEGKPLYTHYKYSFEMAQQVNKRLRRYREKGYNVETKQDWWTTIEIVEGK